MVQMSFTLPVPHSKHRRGRRAPAGANDGHGPGASSSTPSRWGPTTPSSSSTAASTTSWTSTRSRWSSATSRCWRPRRPTRPPVRPAPQARGRRSLHRHRRPHRRHRRHPQHQGLRGREGPGVLPRDQGGEPRRPGLGAGAGRARPRAEQADAVLVSQVVTQRDAHLLNTREMSAAFREAYPSATGARCSWSADPASTRSAPPTSASTGSSAAGTTPADVAWYLVHRLAPGGPPGTGDGAAGTPDPEAVPA